MSAVIFTIDIDQADNHESNPTASSDHLRCQTCNYDRFMHLHITKIGLFIICNNCNYPRLISLPHNTILTIGIHHA